MHSEYVRLSCATVNTERVSCVELIGDNFAFLHFCRNSGNLLVSQADAAALRAELMTNDWVFTDRVWVDRYAATACAYSGKELRVWLRDQPDPVVVVHDTAEATQAAYEAIATALR